MKYKFLAVLSCAIIRLDIQDNILTIPACRLTAKTTRCSLMTFRVLQQYHQQSVLKTNSSVLLLITTRFDMKRMMMR